MYLKIATPNPADTFATQSTPLSAKDLWINPVHAASFLPSTSSVSGLSVSLPVVPPLSAPPPPPQYLPYSLISSSSLSPFSPRSGLFSSLSFSLQPLFLNLVSAQLAKIYDNAKLRLLCLVMATTTMWRRVSGLLRRVDRESSWKKGEKRQRLGSTYMWLSTSSFI